MRVLFILILTVAPHLVNAQVCSDKFIEAYNKLTQSIELYNFSIFMVGDTNPENIPEIVSQNVPEILKNCDAFLKSHGNVVCAANMEDEVVLVNSEGFREECQQAKTILNDENEKPKSKQQDPKHPRGVSPVTIDT